MILWFLIWNYGCNLFSCTLFGGKATGSVFLTLLWRTMWMAPTGVCLNHDFCLITQVKRGLTKIWVLIQSEKYPNFWKFMFQADLQPKLSIVYPTVSLGNCCCSSPWASWLGQICSIISYSLCTVKHSLWKDKTQMNFVYIHTNTSWWFAIRIKSQLISSFPDAVNRGLLHQYLIKQNLETLIVCYFLKADSEISHLKGKSEKEAHSWYMHSFGPLHGKLRNLKKAGVLQAHQSISNHIFIPFLLRSGVFLWLYFRFSFFHVTAVMFSLHMTEPLFFCLLGFSLIFLGFSKTASVLFIKIVYYSSSN